MIMKKILSFILAAVCLFTSVLGGQTAPAVEANKSATMSVSTFEDVDTSHWYYAAVKSVFDNGIMNGTGNEKFDPNGNITLAQAITTAARLHAQYNNTTIQKDDTASWYAPYVAYAKSAELLSDEILAVSNMNDVKATRAQTAYLFYGVLITKEKTVDRINESAIYDLNEVPREYQNAVTNMFAGGIITGISQGYFQGNLLVTRAQIATILNRIINRYERVPYDEKENHELSNQRGNLHMHSGGTVVYNDDYTYFIVMPNTSEHRCDIVQRNNKTGESKVLYVGNGHLYNLRMEKGKLYFAEKITGSYYTNFGGYKTPIIERAYLVEFDLKNNAVRCLYKTNKFETIYAFETYGEKFYVSGSRSGNYNTRIFELDKAGGQRNLVALNSENSVSIFLFGGKLYFSYMYTEGTYGVDLEYKPVISTYDLDTKEISCFIDGKLKAVNYAAGMLYTAEVVGETPTTNFYKYNLANSSDYNAEKVLIGTTDLLNYTIAMSVLNGNVYVSSDKANVIYKLQGDGSLAPKIKTNKQPLCYIITGQSECFYNTFWDSEFNVFYSTKDDTHNGIVSYLGITKEDEATGEQSVATGESVPWLSLNDITITNSYKQNTFTWIDPKAGSVMWTMDINDGLYQAYMRDSRASHIIDYQYAGKSFKLHDYAFYCNSPDDDAYLYGISNYFKCLQEDFGHSPLELAQTAANFVQSIPYVTDKIGTGYDEYPKYPLEILYERAGDCEDSSILLASLYKQLGYECVLLHFDGHMAVGVACPEAQGAYYEENGVRYYYIETTAPGWKVGEIPKDVKDLLLVYEVK